MDEGSRWPDVPRAGPLNGSAQHKHERVREYVRALALAADPGTPAPSERELAAKFGVARMTVRHAIDALVVQGLLQRIPGRGTFVATPAIDMQMRLSSYSEEMERRGLEPASRTLLLRGETAGPGVARALQVEESAPVVHWHRLRLADREPMALQHVYLTEQLFPHLRDDSVPSSLYRWLAENELMPTWGEDSVQGGAARGEDATLLGVAPGAPVLQVARRAFCREVVVEVSRSVYRADRYTLWVPVLRPEPLS